MPTVPRYEPQVRARGFGGQLRSFETPASQGAEIGSALQDLGAMGSRIGDRLFAHEQQMREREDIVAAKRAYTAADDRVRDLLHNPETGFYARRGENALKLTEEATKALDAVRRDATQGLSPRQVERFDALWERLRGGSLDNISRHEANEFRAVEAATSDAMVQAAIADASTNWTDPASVQRAFELGHATLIAARQTSGWSDEIYQQKREAFDSAIHTAIVRNMMTVDPTGARAYYSKHREAIIDVNGALAASLKEEGVRAASQAHADRIVALYGTGAKALAEAKKITDPAERDATETRIRQAGADVERFRTQDERRLSHQAGEIIARGGSIDDIPAEMWTRLDPRAQESLQRFVEFRSKGQEPKDTPTGDALYYELSTQIMARDPAGLDANLYIVAHPYMSRSTYQSLVRLQTAANSRESRDEAKRVAHGRIDTVTKQVLEEMNINTSTSANNPKRDEVARVMGRVHRALEIWQDANGIAKDSDIRAVVNQVMTEVTVPRSMWFDRTARLGMLSPEELAKAFVPYEKIPSRDERAIVSVIQADAKRQGQPAPTGEALQELVEMLYADELQRRLGVGR